MSSFETKTRPLDEGSQFARHVAIALMGVTPDEATTSMPYFVAFGILLAVLSICALSRQAEDDAFLTKPSFLSRSATGAMSSAGAIGAGGAAKRAAKVTRPPELSPQAREARGSGESSPLISLCPQLVVPDKVRVST